MDKKKTVAFRIVSEDGAHFATVYDAEQAAKDREFFADLYGCIVLVKRVELSFNPQGT